MKESYDFWGIFITDKNGNEISGGVLDDIDIENFQGNEGIEYEERDEDGVIGIKNGYEVNNDGIIDLLNVNLSSVELNEFRFITNEDIKTVYTYEALADENELDEFFGHRIDSSEDIYHYGYDTEINHIEGHMELEAESTDGGRTILFDVDGSIFY